MGQLGLFGQVTEKSERCVAVSRFGQCILERDHEVDHHLPENTDPGGGFWVMFGRLALSRVEKARAAKRCAVPSCTELSSMGWPLCGFHGEAAVELKIDQRKLHPNQLEPIRARSEQNDLAWRKACKKAEERDEIL